MEPLALKLVMVQGPREGETLDFRPCSKLRIGRVVRGNNITIKDSGISSKHLSIDSESGKWVLRDLDSSNGTLLNGTKAPPDTPLDLCDGDEIKIGEYTKITVKIDGHEESRARRNPRRGGVVPVEETSVGPVAESRSRRGRVEKESEVKSELEKENCEESEVVVKPRRGRPPKARVLKNVAADEKPVGENSVRQVSTRQTRSSNKAKERKIPESSGVDGERVIIEPKRTCGNAKGRKNAPEEQLECSNVDVNDVEDDEASKRLNLEEERHENVSGEKGNNGSGSGSGVNESCDLEKMTLGEWFDFLEVYLPKQIIDETEEAIAEMVEKAKRLREYMAQQKEKGHVPVG